MRLIYTFSFVFFFVATSLGQTFTLSELIKMSKMEVDDFDTYVTAKGFVFSKEDINNDVKGVEYALEINQIDRFKALKFLTLYQSYYNYKNAISYQTPNRKEYISFKNQIKALGFKLEKSDIFTKSNGISANSFDYKKGKVSISLYASSTVFEINYKVDY